MSTPPDVSKPTVSTTNPALGNAPSPQGNDGGGDFDALLALLLQGEAVLEANPRQGNGLPLAEVARQTGSSPLLTDEAIAAATGEAKEAPVAPSLEGEAQSQAQPSTPLPAAATAEDLASPADEPLSVEPPPSEVAAETAVVVSPPLSAPEIVVAVSPPLSAPEIVVAVSPPPSAPAPGAGTKTAVPRDDEPLPLADVDRANVEGEMAGLSEGAVKRHFTEVVERPGVTPRSDGPRREVTAPLSQTPNTSPEEMGEAMTGSGAAGDDTGSNSADDKTAQSRAQVLAQLAQRFQVLREQNTASVGAEEAVDGTFVEGLAEGEGLSEMGRPAANRLNLGTPLQDPRWGRDFSERILWLARSDQSRAEIRLNPRHLGPIQVQIQLDDDQAKVHIQAHHPATREAVEAALPKLRDSLAEAGIQLSDAQVSGQGGENARRGDSQQRPPFFDASSAAGGDEVASVGEAVDERRWRSDGLLNTFA